MITSNLKTLSPQPCCVSSLNVSSLNVSSSTSRRDWGHCGFWTRQEAWRKFRLRWFEGWASSKTRRLWRVPTAASDCAWGSPNRWRVRLQSLRRCALSVMAARKAMRPIRFSWSAVALSPRAAAASICLITCLCFSLLAKALISSREYHCYTLLMQLRKNDTFLLFIASI